MLNLLFLILMTLSCLGAKAGELRTLGPSMPKLDRVTVLYKAADTLFLKAGFSVPNLTVLNNERGAESRAWVERNLIRYDLEDYRARYQSWPEDKMFNEVLLPILVHEYGHILLLNHLAQTDDTFVKTNKALKLIADVSAQFQKVPYSDEVKRDILREKYEQAVGSFIRNKMKPEGLSAGDVVLITQPYTELISDLLAALIFKNSEVNVWPVNGWTPSRDSTRARGFANFIPLSTVDQRDPHEQLTEVRPIIWNMYRALQIKSNTPEASILKIVVNASIGEIKRRIQSNEVKIAPKQMTLQFERIIQQQALNFK